MSHRHNITFDGGEAFEWLVAVDLELDVAEVGLFGQDGGAPGEAHARERNGDRSFARQMVHHVRYDLQDTHEYRVGRREVE